MNIPKIYNYHPDNFEYLGQSLADCSPMEEGVFLFPAFSTLQPPPILEKNQSAVFLISQDKWQVINDYRGEIWFDSDGAEVKVNNLGDPSALGLRRDAPQKEDKCEDSEQIYPVLTARQIRLLLRRLDKLTLVEGLINALPHPKKDDAQIEWDYGASFDHEHFLVQQIVTGLEIDLDKFNQAWLEFSNI